MISVVAGPENTGSIAPPDSARSGLRSKRGPPRSRATFRCVQAPGQRADCPTARPTAAFRAKRVRASRCSQTHLTRLPRHRSLVARHPAAPAVSGTPAELGSPLARSRLPVLPAVGWTAATMGSLAAETLYTLLWKSPAHAALVVEWPCGPAYAERCGEEG